MNKKITFHGIEIKKIDYDFDPLDPKNNPDIPGFDLYERHLVLPRDSRDDEDIKNFALERLSVNLIETQENKNLTFENIKWWGKPHFITGQPRLGWSARSKRK